MKKLISAAFIAALAVASWSAIGTSDKSESQSLTSLASVEALTQTEVEIRCSSGSCGWCFLWSNSGRCVYSGYCVDYCAC